MDTTTAFISAALNGRFKTCIVANDHPQILGFDSYDVHAPTIPMAEINSFLVFVLIVA
jgi:hypothetical protein